VMGEEYDAADIAQKAAVQWASGDGPWNDYRCDCYLPDISRRACPLRIWTVAPRVLVEQVRAQ
jgi:hypothetical protein